MKILFNYLKDVFSYKLIEAKRKEIEFLRLFKKEYVLLRIKKKILKLTDNETLDF